MMFEFIPVHLRSATLIFFGVMLVVVTSVIASMMYRNNASRSEVSAYRAMSIWKNKIEGSRQSGIIVDKYEQDYLGLVKQSVIGDEDRLSWFETIQHVSDTRHLKSVKYSVFIQKKMETPTMKQKYSGLTLYKSPMTLDAIIGHEGDLFALLNGLQDRARGLFTVDKCNLELETPAANSVHAVNSDTDHMKAHCELSWYTIKAAK